MIEIEKITIKGFGSILDEVEFKLNRKGLNVIRGKTGAGKTTIPSALSWCLFGTTLKGKATVATWPELRGDNFKGTMVKVEFIKEGIKYEIIRCISYKERVIGKTKGGSNIFIIENGVPLESERNKTDKQAYIEKLLGYSYDLFTNSIVFGQKLKRIIEESGPNKKKIFDEAFEVMFIDQAKKKTEIDRDKVTSAISDIESEQSKLEELIADALENYDDAIEFEKSFEKTKRNNLGKLLQSKDKLTEKVNNLSNEVSMQSVEDSKNLRDKVEDVERLIDKSEKSNRKILKLDRDITEISKQIKLKEVKLKEVKNGECPLCKSEITSKKTSHIREDIKIVIKELNGDLINLNKNREGLLEIDIKDLNKQLGKLQKKLGKQKEKERNLKELKISLLNYKDELETVKSDIQATKKDKLVIKSPKYKDKLVKFKKKNKKLIKELRILTSKNDIYKWLIKDPLSNNGLKAYIFDSLLGKVNDKLTELEKHLGFRVEFGIDLESSRKDFYQVIYKDDMVILYTDLSGGQKQLVDFSVALAIHKVISSIRPMNIIFFDEPFEGLDTDCVDIISELISDEAKDKSLFMITHHPNFNPITSNNIHFRLDSNGVTKIN